MPQSTQCASSLREEAKQHYRDKKNIEKKWLDQYGGVSRDNDFQRNRSCLAELFNMLDVVMDIVIENFRHSHSIVAIDIKGRTPVYTFALSDTETVTFSMPSSFARRVRVLRMIGYAISDDLFYDTRFLRNETTHGNKTVILQNLQVGYNEIIKAVLSIADALICIGMLPEELRIPSFERLRVREGDSLLGGVYVIREQIGEGGMSRVYRAFHARTGRILAVKEMKPDTFSEEVIRNECDILSRLHHEGIPQIRDSFSENSTFYIVMDLVVGIPLDRFLAGRDLKEAERDLLIRKLCAIMRYLHSNEIGVVFADLSPDNILVDGNAVPYLIDFGISGKMNAKQSIPAATAGYSAPEVFAERMLDRRSDIYSLGQILYLLYTGRAPDSEESVREEQLAALPDTVSDVIRQCTARNPQERYGSIEEVERALFHLVESDTDKEERKASAIKKRRGIRFGLAAACIVLIAGAAGTVVYTRFADKNPANTALSETEISFEASGLTDHVMEWEDPMMEWELRQTVGIEEGDVLLSDVWEIRELSLANCGIRSIEGLQEMTNLQYLDLNFNEVEDLSPLAHLTGLKTLRLQGNAVRDIRPLSGLVLLEELDIGSNSVSDMTPLEKLERLSVLSVSHNPVSGEDLVRILQALPLRSVDLSGLGLTECGWLSAFEDLEELYISNNEITDITPVSFLTRLNRLYMSGNKIQDISSLSALKELSELDLQYNPVDDIRTVAGMKKLTWLDFKGCRITDLTPVSSLEMLVSMDGSDNHISDLTPVSSLVRLSYLDLGGNAISGSLDGLEALKSLNYLDLRNNRITDIGALSSLKSLQRLYLTGNEITDFSALSGLRLIECETDQK